MNKIGVNYTDHFATDMNEGLKLLADIGFETVFTEYFDDLYTDNFAASAYKNGLLYESLHAPFDKINDIWSCGEEGDLMLARLCDCVKACGRNQIPIAVVHLSSGPNAPRINDVGYGRFSRLVEDAVKNNVTLAFENQRKLANLAFVFETFADVENVGFCWDVGHETCFTDGIEFMNLFGSKIVYTHIHDNLSQHNGDLHLIPFDGNIDYEKCMQHIKNHHFSGTLTLELAPMAEQYRDCSFEDFHRKTYRAAQKLRDMIL